jgi:hypothetical protein
MVSFDMTILICLNASIFSYNSPPGNSSASISICKVLCSLVSCVRDDCTISSYVLGHVDGTPPDWCSFVMHDVSSIFKSIPS